MNAIEAAAAPPAFSRESRRLHVTAKADDVSRLDLRMSHEPVRWGPGQAVIEISAAAVNPSDVKATLGMMPHARWPRTPGRDFAGTVVEGPTNLLGLEVWGSSGELGISRDGSHGTHLVVDLADVLPKPRAMSMIEAGAVGVPFVTAWKGFERSGFPKAGMNVAVLGATGKVGQAAIQIASMLGARTIGVMREGAAFDGYHANPVSIVSGNGAEAAARIRELTDGHGADIVFNTVGSPYFDLARQILALHAHQILIATIDRAVPFDILQFYRGQQTFVGIDTLALSTAETIAILGQMVPSFESGALKPFPVLPSSIYTLDQAKEAYAKVLGSSRDRLVLVPGGA
ncbi:zinc-binding alcohol dehydrogenase family protein [Bosea sp. BK604]|uniref:quinone oxidoreductase family protein n=1 Tax=Bosea sp. BK604 TaxID=2512180 RepID=UPI00104F3F55|nr:zinc-binding alcohol dehydrogenase family protein [Bosea sp. BK604]TCR70465.1 NADPH:quinone reductase-like Zn-dependent oxidoreductase [Bosea sp. BK604]